MIRKILENLLVTSLSIFSNDVFIEIMKRRPTVRHYEMKGRFILMEHVNGREFKEIDEHGPSIVLVIP